MEENDVLRDPAAPVDPVTEEFERIPTGEAATVGEVEAPSHVHEPPSGEGGSKASLVRACVARFSIHCDARWEAHTPPS
jgi:hypothetical protein